MTASARGEWLTRQFPRASSIAEVLDGAGWIHTAGGTGPYLALHARLRGLHRSHVDDAVYRKLDVLELPAVRETTMLVPRDDAAIALAAGRRSFEQRLAKLPVDRQEIERLADRVMKTLGDGIRTPDRLRSEIPVSFIRSLGEEGKKIGYASTLPIALRLLQVEGRVLRVAEEFRLDTNAYFYRRWPDSLAIGQPPGDLDAALAARFLRWAGPATTDDFAWWAGIGKTAAKKAMKDLASPPAPAAPEIPRNILLPFRDNYFSLHRGLQLFAEGIELLDHRNKPAPIARLESLHHNAIVAGGELRGLWEYDPSEERIVWRLFKTTKGIAPSIRDTEQFIREELGDHKFYAFDRGRTRELRLAFVRNG